MEYRICVRCCMDTSAREIVFDEKGVCSFCHQAQKALKEIEKEKQNRPWVIHEIKKSGQGKEYDCLIGLSGGVDSSLALHYAVEQGLRPLCYQVDNGWNTPEADENVMRMVEGLKVPFYRYTINLERFRALQRAFIQSGTANIEIPTDHILMATSYEMASKYGIKYIISGGNVATESIMPASWGYNACDLRFIRNVAERHGASIKGLPTCGILKYNWYLNVKKIKIVYILDYYDYNREQTKKLLSEKYGWKDYGEKHCENLYTKWFQNHYLPMRFGYDKRKAHYSSLINSGQMTREDAIKALRFPVAYGKINDPAIDKFLFSDNLYIRWVKEDYGPFIPLMTHKDYSNNEYWFNLISRMMRAWKTR